MGEITRWHRDEAAYLDVCTIQALSDSLGHARAREVMSDAALEMISKAARLDRAIERDDREVAKRLSRSLATLSDQIGLKEYSQATRNLSECLKTDDMVAIAAVAARAARLGETSLHTLLELAYHPEL